MKTFSTKNKSKNNEKNSQSLWSVKIYGDEISMLCDQRELEGPIRALKRAEIKLKKARIDIEEAGQEIKDAMAKIDYIADNCPVPFYR